MNARCITLFTVFAVLITLSTCTSPGDDVKPEALPQAPAPRVKGQGQPPPVEVSVAPRRSNKPWTELIVGKWHQVNRKDLIGDMAREFTREGKVIARYSYPARPNHPKGIAVSTWEYKVSGNVLFPTSTDDDGIWITEYTTFIETLTENELVTLSVKRTRKSMEIAKADATRRKLPLEQVLAEAREEQGRTYYVRFKDK